MHPELRRAFNRHYTPELFARYKSILEKDLGPFPFRLAETPLIFTRHLLDRLQEDALGIVAQLSREATLKALKKAIPAHYDAPGMSSLPDCVQIDFALVSDPRSGELVGRVVELQAFPSLYALETVEADAWNQVLGKLPGLEGEWTCFFSEDRAEGVRRMRDCIVGDADPAEVALVDYEPDKQKTSPDFVATKKLFDVDTVCVTDLEKEGRRLFRNKDGKRVRVARVYNRLVFDELENKGVTMPFSWTDDLDVTWCSHPNWYWVWSKYSLPHLDHHAVPETTYLSDMKELPADLSQYVMKPLFSYAGSGVVVDVTKEAIDAVPEAARRHTILQRKVEYAWAIRMPHAKEGEPLGAHNAVKAEVRVMVMRSGEGQPLLPLLPLVRLSRGKMLGVDQNKSAETEWTGGSVGVWIARK